MLSFLHTAESNVAVVGRLMAEMAPEIPIRHQLAPDLLAEAVKAGTVTEAVAAGVRTRHAARLEAFGLAGHRARQRLRGDDLPFDPLLHARSIEQ